jgi:hypothetical protein
MAIYRLVWRDAQGNVSKSTQVERATDRSAIEVAERLIDNCEIVDIWEGFRRVGRVGNPNKATSG